MKRITIERTKNPADTGSAGLIEGETDSGQRWILFLDAQGAPKVFWPEREADGAVVGTGILLDKRTRKAVEILNGPEPIKRMRAALDAAESLQEDPERLAEVKKAMGLQ